MARARDQYVDVLRIREPVLGPEHADTLNSRESIAYVTRLAGDARLEPATNMPPCSPSANASPAPEHPRTLITRGNLACETGRRATRPKPPTNSSTRRPDLGGPWAPSTLTVRGSNSPIGRGKRSPAGVVRGVQSKTFL